MASQAILHQFSEAASEEQKQWMRQLWVQFLDAINHDRPIIFLPKLMGDRIGELALEAMASRFGYVRDFHEI